MSPPPARILVGLMSGTSLDGISAAVVRFADDARGRPRAELLGFTSRAYDGEVRARLAAAMHHGTARDYCRLHADVGDWLADAALDAMQCAGVTARHVAAIASHGQTLWHEPGHSTWQIGDPARLAERTGCAVIADFRTRDMAVGGQGAPLVPMADVLLFAHDTHWRALQHIGGIGNVTIVPPAADATDARVRAFDTGPGVVIIDGAVQRLFGQPFDRDGAIAASGSVLEAVVQELLELPFLHAAPPKSTGRELFTPAFIDAFIARCTQAGASPADAVATATAYTAATIADQYARFVPEPITEVLISGGGAHNPALVRALQGALAWHEARSGRAAPAVRLFDDVYFDAEAKEAVAFALLGYLHLTGRAGNVPSATGARASRILGALTPV
ncbi:MAG: anhydro-N-acetylmuramic acid kinase [Gemmatimonas sp.]|uniref:anhydro-N-acetylmuramic acid kinase n=1 Tax=Gemmatimonas sp. TaxID=1962908 RepID=UPI00391F4FA3